MFLALITLLGITASSLAHLSSGGQNVLSPGQSMVFNSPNYPYNYPTPYSCSWAFSSPTPVNYTIECRSFNIYYTQGCQLDYMELPGADLTKMRYCGNGYLFNSFYGSAFNVIFKSNPRYKSARHFYSSPYVFQCTVSATTGTATTATPTSTTTATTTTTTTTSTTAAPVVSNGTASSNVTVTPKCECGKKNPAARIVGGQFATTNEYPYQCMLRTTTGSQYCGCSLICQKYVLTAAHCTDGSTASSIMVTLGDHQKNVATETNQAVTVGVQNIIQHPNYNSQTVDNDIALLELATPVNFTYGVSPVCLPFGMGNTSIAGVNTTVTGWGTTSSGGTSSATLQEVTLPALTTQQCQQYYGSAVTNNMICTYEPGKDSCQGDSGGPLVMENNGNMVQMGVVSWGSGCAELGKPGVYTKVTNYLDWIKTNTANSPSCQFCQP